VPVVTVHAYRGGNGKSSVAVNLSYFLAKKGYKVAVIDSDMQAPSLQHFLSKYDRDPAEPEKLFPEFMLYLSIPFEDTLARAHVADVELIASFSARIEDLDIMLLGAVQSVAPTELESEIQYERMRDAISILTKKYGCDYVVIDTTPGVQRYSLMQTAGVADIVLHIIRDHEFEYAQSHWVLDPSRQILEERSRREAAFFSCKVVINEAIGKKYVGRLKKAKIPEDIVLCVIPFYEDLRTEDNPGVFAADHPDHSYARDMLRLTDDMVQLGK